MQSWVLFLESDQYLALDMLQVPQSKERETWIRTWISTTNLPKPLQRIHEKRKLPSCGYCRETETDNWGLRHWGGRGLLVQEYWCHEHAPAMHLHQDHRFRISGSPNGRCCTESPLLIGSGIKSKLLVMRAWSQWRGHGRGHECRTLAVVGSTNFWDFFYSFFDIEKSEIRSNFLSCRIPDWAEFSINKKYYHLYFKKNESPRKYYISWLCSFK